MRNVRKQASLGDFMMHVCVHLQVFAFQMLPKEAKVYKHVLKCQLNASDSNQQVQCNNLNHSCYGHYSNSHPRCSFFVYRTCCSQGLGRVLSLPWVMRYVCICVYVSGANTCVNYVCIQFSAVSWYMYVGPSFILFLLTVKKT